MTLYTIFAELMDIYRLVDGVIPQTARVKKEDLERWSRDTGEPLDELLDQIAHWLARSFARSELSFEFCDAVINDVHWMVMDAWTVGGEPPSQLLWDVYLAFDAGEYFHDAEHKEDPIQTYTRPAIEKFLRTYAAPDLKNDSSN